MFRATPVAQRRRHLSYKEAFTAGSSPAGGTAEWTGVGLQHGLISRPTPVQIRPPQLDGLEVLWPHAALVSAEDRVRPPAGPLGGCSSNRKTPPSQGGNRGAIPRRSTRAGGRKAVIRRPWEPESVGSTPTPLTVEWARGPTGRRQPGVLAMRVRLPPGPLPDREEPAWTSTTSTGGSSSSFRTSSRPKSATPSSSGASNSATPTPRSTRPSGRWCVRTSATTSASCSTIPDWRAPGGSGPRGCSSRSGSAGRSSG